MLILPVILNLLFLLDIIPGFTFDPTPVIFIFISPVLVYGILRFQIFDLPDHRL